MRLFPGSKKRENQTKRNDEIYIDFRFVWLIKFYLFALAGYRASHTSVSIVTMIDMPGTFVLLDKSTTTSQNESSPSVVQENGLSSLLTNYFKDVLQAFSTAFNQGKYHETPFVTEIELNISALLFI